MSIRLSQLVHLLDDRQHRRILRLSFPNQDGPATPFLVNALEATEGVSRDFDYTVELLSENPDVALKDMMGKLLSVELVRGDGSLRYFSGYVFSFRCKRSDGAITFYEANLGPWVRYLGLRKDSYLFHGATLRDQTAAVFADYATHANWEWRVAGEDPVWTDACQFDETDFNYLSRRWEAAGYLYWYEHTAAGHQIVIADDSTAAPSIDGTSIVSFQRHGGIREEDAIDLWSPVRRLAPGSISLGTFDFKAPGDQHAVIPTVAQQGAVPSIDSYEYLGAYGFDSHRAGDQLARLRMEEFEGSSKYYEGEGNNRFCMPGRHLQIVDHFAYDPFNGSGGATDSQFLILSVHHSATNNYLQQGDRQPYYRNRLTCTRRNVPWRPGRGFNSAQTRILAPQTATVVGPAGPDSIHTDEYGRVRVQFHWDRVGTSDERSSAWVRVTSPWAGGELGAASIPRVGSEVIVQWLDGNPDRPIITGGVHNAHHMPPWELPGQQALMGLRSRELAPNSGNTAGGRSNHLILDDTHAAIQVQLKSDHACSQLSLGNIARIDDTRGRKEARGEGWEVSTDAWGVARAAKGMLITTEHGHGAATAAKEMSQSAARLAAASDEQDAQAELAEHFGAHEKAGLHGAVATAIHAQNSAMKGAQGDARFPELAEPQLVLAGAAGIAMTSGKSTHIASTDHAALTTGQSLSLAAGHSLFANVRQAFRLFVHKAGMKLIAASGDIDIKALNDSINVLAKLNITQTANKIVISAKEEVQINGAGSYVKFSAAGIEHGTTGTFTAHAASHSLVGPQGLEAVQQKVFEEAKPRKYSQQVLVDAALWQLPAGMRQVSYKFISEADTVLGSGTLDGEGKSARLFTDTAQATAVELDINMGKWLQLVTERHDEICHAPTTAQIVFDYADHEDDPVLAGDDDQDDPDLSQYDITA